MITGKDYLACRVVSASCSTFYNVQQFVAAIGFLGRKENKT